MIYVTGDCHGNFERFKAKYFPEQARMTKQDIMICSGDFGGVWFGDSRDDETLDWLERLPFTLVFVCGNHDRILLCARLDNLGKGASGAAVQCMNLMIGAPEDTGLTSVYEKE